MSDDTALTKAASNITFEGAWIRLRSAYSIADGRNEIKSQCGGGFIPLRGMSVIAGKT